MATMKDVAKDAGLSVATVSRYINKSGYISEESKEKIEASINKLGYYPNEVARSLFKQSSKIIGVLVPDIKNPYFNELVKAVEARLMQEDYLMVLADISEDDDKLQHYSKLFSQHNVSGLLISTGKLLDYKNLEQTPKVYMDRIMNPVDHSVVTDDFYGGLLIGQHVSMTEAESILLIKGPENFVGSKERFSGVKDKLSSKHKILESNIASYNIDYLKQVAKELVDSARKVDTIICPNDYLAIQVIKECSKRKIKVPKDLQIIGYDGIPSGDYISPGLTTVRQPVDSIGKLAAEMLIKRIHKPKDDVEESSNDDKHIRLKPKLVIRESTRQIIEE